MYNGPLFYPDPIFGWTSYAVLLGFLAIATYTDVRKLIIPKTLTLPMLGVGLIFSIVRGIWMGSVLQGSSEGVVWHFARSPGLGMVDGLICAWRDSWPASSCLSSCGGWGLCGAAT